MSNYPFQVPDQEFTLSVAPVTPPPPRKHTVRKVVGLAALFAVATGIGAVIGSAGSHTVTKTVTVTRTVRIPVPGPVKTVIRTVPAPPPPAGSVIGTFHGSGSQVTPRFNVPSSGDYIVKWSYSGNTDPSVGIASNFIVLENGGGLSGELPNDIAAAGSGSTEITGVNGTDSLNVQSTGQWTITIVSAP